MSPPLMRLRLTAWDGSGDDGAYAFSWRFGQGPWSPFTTAREITLRRSELLWQGRHRIEIQARRVDDYRSLDPTPARVEVLVDIQPPRLVVEADGTSVTVVARDHVSPSDAIRLEWRASEADVWRPLEDVTLGPDAVVALGVPRWRARRPGDRRGLGSARRGQRGRRRRRSTRADAGAGRCAARGVLRPDGRFAALRQPNRDEWVDDGAREDPARGPVSHLVGADCALRFDAQGHPLVVYQDATGHELLLARRAPDGVWSRTVIAGGGETYDGSYGFATRARVLGEMLWVSRRCEDPADPDRAARATAAMEVFLGWAPPAEAPEDGAESWAACPARSRGSSDGQRCVGSRGDGALHGLEIPQGGGGVLGIALSSRG